MTERPLTALFLSALGERGAMGNTSSDRLEETLSKVFDDARATWPALDVPPERYMPYLAERSTVQEDPICALEKLVTGDLYLACGCAHKLPAALKAFDHHFGDRIVESLTRYRASDELIRDVRQQLWQKLFVADGDGTGDIVRYLGRGTLLSWLRVTAAHMAFRILRREQREIPDEQRLLHAISCDTDDPELEYLKHYYKARFKQAFHRAMASLSARDRNLLRQRVLDNLTIDDIGALYKVHRVTASRWLVKLRQILADKTRDFIIEGLEISDYEYESIVRIIHSQLDFTISAYLASEPNHGKVVSDRA